MTNKTKNILLIIGFVLGLVICYKLAFKKTLLLKKEYIALKNEQILFENTPKQLSILKQKQQHYDSILAANRFKGGSFQNNLLKTINLFADQSNLKIVNLVEPHTHLNEDIKTQTHEIIVEGSYNATISLVYQLEQYKNFGKIINLHFERKRNLRANKNKLTTRILIQFLSQV